MRPSTALLGALVLTLSSSAMADPLPSPPPPTPPPAPTSAQLPYALPPPPGAPVYTPPPLGPPPPYGYPPYATPTSPFDHNLPMPMKTHSYALMGGGIALTGIGAVSLLAGTLTIVGDLQGGGDLKGLATMILGVPLVVHGLGCIGGGIPMILIGAKKIPVHSPPNRPGLLPHAMIGVRSATLRWSF